MTSSIFRRKVADLAKWNFLFICCLLLLGCAGGKFSSYSSSAEEDHERPPIVIFVQPDDANIDQGKKTYTWNVAPAKTSFARRKISDWLTQNAGAWRIQFYENASGQIVQTGEEKIWKNPDDVYNTQKFLNIPLEKMLRVDVEFVRGGAPDSADAKNDVDSYQILFHIEPWKVKN